MAQLEPRLEVLYGCVDSTEFSPRYSYVVVRTSAAHIDPHADVYHPGGELEVLYELPLEEITRKNLPIPAQPGLVSAEVKQLVLEAWREQESSLPVVVPTKRRHEGEAQGAEEGDLLQATLHLSNENANENSEGGEQSGEGLLQADPPSGWEEAQDPKNMSLDLEGEGESKECEGDRSAEGDEQDEEEAVDVGVLNDSPVEHLLAFLSSKDFSYLPDAGEFESFDVEKHFDYVMQDVKQTEPELARWVEECLCLYAPTDIARVVLECDNHACNMMAVFVLRLLFHRGADPGIVAGVEQVNMPIVAAEWGEAEFLMELLERGIAIEHRGPNGMTVLHHLVSNLPNLDPRKFKSIVSVAQALLSLEPNLTLRSHTQDTALQVLETNIELGGLSFRPDSPPPEIWQLCALLQQAFSDFETHPCLKCGRPAANNRCSRCQVVRYCGAGCQKQHWKFHKRVCVEKIEPKAETP